ncbi:hypothetical protein C8F01DRAFT_1264842 [Mycena amicta]|nr:hypothetical protein C8F01DRAFT_1264842 [Mycena amicta]
MQPLSTSVSTHAVSTAPYTPQSTLMVVDDKINLPQQYKPELPEALSTRCLKYQLSAGQLVLYDDILLARIFGVHNRPKRQDVLKVLPMGYTQVEIGAAEAKSIAETFTQTTRAAASATSPAEYQEIFEHAAVTVSNLLGVHQIPCGNLQWWLEIYGILYSNWSRAKMTKVVLGGSKQFGLSATQDIPAGTDLWEIPGLLSLDEAANADNTGLSKMKHRDGTDRILSGPVRFVNHHCKDFNTEYTHVRRSRGIILSTTRAISAGEEITVNYGTEFFDPTLLCSCCVPAAPEPATPQPAALPPMVPLRTAEEKREKELARRHKLMKYRKEKKRGLFPPA